MSDDSDNFSIIMNTMNTEREYREGVKESCKDIDHISRELSNILQIVHTGEKNLAPTIAKAKELFVKAKAAYDKLKTEVDPMKYYKYEDYWRGTNQRFCFLIALTIWLDEGILAEQALIANILGLLPAPQTSEFHLEMEDYLMGLLILCTELSRLSINSAVHGDVARTVTIADFVGQIYAGFLGMDLKSETLRKRYEVLKYDLQKVEEIVCDLSLRGFLHKKKPTALAAQLVPEASGRKMVPVAAVVGQNESVAGDGGQNESVAADSGQNESVAADGGQNESVAADGGQNESVAGDGGQTESVTNDSCVV